MLYYLSVLGRIEVKDFSAEMMEMLALQNKTEMEDFIAQKYGLQLTSKNLLQLNLYNFVEHFLQEFSIQNKETDFLFNYMEMLYAFSQNTASTLKDFIRYWDEEANATTIQASENLDAVKLMTIHKAKGLEFPVVFLPMENEHKDGKFSNWLDIDSENGLSSVNINPFGKELEAYDENMAKFNQENIYQNKIDRYCLQYVATTRAVEELFFYIEKPNKTSNNLEIYEFLEPKIPRDENGETISSFDLYKVSDENSQSKNKATREENITKPILFKSGNKKNPNAIKIATPSKNYQNRIEKVRTGIFTHEILSKINSEKDVERTLEAYVLEGIITLEEKAVIHHRISNIINHDIYSKFFVENQLVINEKDIMISENGESQIYRPDRLINTGEGYIIIDFKTGDEQEKHLVQINEYKSVLEKLGKKVLETQLVYV